MPLCAAIIDSLKRSKGGGGPGSPPLPSPAPLSPSPLIPSRAGSGGVTQQKSRGCSHLPDSPETSPYPPRAGTAHPSPSLSRNPFSSPVSPVIPKNRFIETLSFNPFVSPSPHPPSYTTPSLNPFSTAQNGTGSLKAAPTLLSKDHQFSILRPSHAQFPATLPGSSPGPSPVSPVTPPLPLPASFLSVPSPASGSILASGPSHSVGPLPLPDSSPPTGTSAPCYLASSSHALTSGSHSFKAGGQGPEGRMPEGTEALLATPVIYNRAGTYLWWEPFPQQDLKELCKAAKEFGRDSQYFRSFLLASFDPRVLVPHDLKSVMACLLSQSTSSGSGCGKGR